MRKISCSLIYEGNILAKVGGFSLKNVASSNLHFILYVIKKSNNEMPFTNSYIQDGFNKKNLQTVLHVPFVVVAIYYEKMHKLIIIKHQAKHVFISSAYLLWDLKGGGKISKKYWRHCCGMYIYAV